MKMRTKILFFASLAFLPIVQQLNAQSWEKIPAFSDEFSSGLDTTKWVDHDPDWFGRWPSYFEANNITVSGGKLNLKCEKIATPFNGPEGVYTHATAALKSKTKVLYGYFEIRAKGIGLGYWNAFWFYDANGSSWTEIDVFELVANHNYRFSTAHVFYLPGIPARADGASHPELKQQKEFFNIPSPTGYHTYALYWDEDTIAWSVDGEWIFSAANLYWHQPLYMMTDAEISTWPGYPGSGTRTYEVDYIRTWKNNRLKSIGAPTTVSRGQTITFPVAYEAATDNKVITCLFRGVTSPWSTYATGTKTVGVGVGTTNITMTIPSNTPLGNNQFYFQTLIGDGTWAGRKNELKKWSITVTN